jgi:hypothetical protein
MEDFILLFLNMSCHLKYFKTTVTKMHDFILEFYKTKLNYILFYWLSMR